MNFSLKTVFIASHRFWKAAFLFSFVLRCFLISSLISLDSSQSTASVSASNGHPHPLHMQYQVQACSGCHKWALSLALAAFSLHPNGELHWNKRCQGGCSTWAGTCTGVVMGNWPEPWAVSTCFLRLVTGSKQAYVHSSRAESRFLTALLLVPLFFKPAKGTPLPGAWSQGYSAQYVVKLLMPQGESWSPSNPPPLLCPLLGAQIPPRSLLFPSYPTLCGCFSTALVA